MQEFRKEGLMTLGFGIVLLAVGGVITAATYSSAGSGGALRRDHRLVPRGCR